jgi:hypothetical protein
MDVRDSGVGNPGAIAVDVESGGNELTQLIPVIGQFQERKVTRENNQRGEKEKGDRHNGPDKAAA